MRRFRWVGLSLSAVVFACAPTGADGPGAQMPASTVAMPVARPLALSRIPIRAEGAPLSLTASDGTGLKLTSMKARAVVEEPLAFTELRLSFENPLDRTLEGTFRIALPESASLSRFAMRIGDNWQEGEVVEKARARVVYEDFLHRKQDPALLEKSAGNEFSARVFPIPPRAKKEIVISYSHELTGGVPYVLPLVGLPALASLDIEVTHANGESMGSVQRKDVAPDRDFVVEPKSTRPRDGLRSGDLVLARVRPMAQSEPDPLTSAVILVDTSASRALSFASDLALVEKLARQVADRGGANAPLAVVAFDQTQEVLFEGKAGEMNAAVIAKLRERAALGASNVDAALGFVADVVRRTGARRLLLVSDGVGTAGEVDFAKLGARAEILRGVGLERIDAVAVGGIRDDAGLRALVHHGMKRDGVVADAALPFEGLAWRLSERTTPKLPVKVEGARFVYPESIDGLQAGDDALVFAEVPPGAPVKIKVGEKTITPELSDVAKPLLERAWAKAKIDSIVRGPKRDSDEARQQVVALSTAYRVLSPHTALLVLETEHDYQRFNVDRLATSNILTIDGGRLTTARRGALPANVEPSREENTDRTVRREPINGAPPANRPGAPPEAPRPAAKAVSGDPLSARGNMWGNEVGDAFGAGGLGLSGAGEGGGGRGEGIGLGAAGTIGRGAGTSSGQGFGSGSGRLGGSHASRSVPQIRQGPTTVSGRMPPEVIQRIVRQNFGRFRLCYENGLRSDPTLAGRVSVRFVIGTDGAVKGATDAGSTLASSAVVSCVVRAFDRLSFPTPEGGTVTVTYPLSFAPDSSSATPSRPWGSPEPPTAPVAAAPEMPQSADPYTGRMKSVMSLIAAKAKGDALRAARVWHDEAPADVMSLLALGEAFEANEDAVSAGRAYGSLIDLFPNRADVRRHAGERLERLARDKGALDLAVDTYEKAAVERPDHPSSHRLLAFARVRRGDFQRAFEAIEKGIHQFYPSGRFAGVDRILREDAGLIAAAWMRAEPKRAAEISERLKAAGGTREDAPSLRFVLNWETDANDVDFHIFDAQGGHASYQQRVLASGGELYADVTTGYGPECFAIRKPAASRSAKYTLQAHYYSRGPMGYGMGKLQVIDHDGKGGLRIEDRPFVVMVDQAFVDLGTAR